MKPGREIHLKEILSSTDWGHGSDCMLGGVTDMINTSWCHLRREREGDEASSPVDNDPDYNAIVLLSTD